MAEPNHLENIARAIEKGTRVATLDELKAKGQSSFKVINAAKIMELIRDAVEMAVTSMTGQKLTGEKEKLQALAKKEFDDLLRKYQDTQKSKGDIEGQAAKMQAEIDAVAALLAGGGGGDAAKMGLAGISGQIAQLVQKLQASEKARIDGAMAQKKAEEAADELRKQYAAMEAEKSAAMETGQGVARAVNDAYSKIDASLGMKAREMGLNLGPEPRTPEEKMQRLAQIAEAAVQGIEKEKGEKAEVKRQLAETTAKKEAVDRELAMAKDSKQSLEKRLDEQGQQLNQVVQEKVKGAAEAERLREQIASLESKKASLEREQSMLQEFKKTLEGKTGDQASQLAQVQQELAKTKQDLAQTKAARDQFEEKLSETSARKSVLEAELTATSGNKSSVERELSQARQDLAQTKQGKEQAEQKLAQTESAKQKVEQTLAQTQAKKSVAEKELGELQDFKKKLEEKVDEAGSQYEEVHQMMARIGQRADDLIREVESGRLKHLKPEEKKIIIDAMTSINADLKKLQDERAFLEKKLFYMSMTIDSLEAELLAAKGLTPSVGGSAHLKDDGLVVTFDEAGVAAL
ncbi:MAG: hypothetical protein K8T20_02340 [Planctomycetes bacterium]|nr:hypothetical protein [Planctomycetota bacterium]